MVSASARRPEHCAAPLSAPRRQGSLEPSAAGIEISSDPIGCGAEHQRSIQGGHTTGLLCTKPGSLARLFRPPLTQRHISSSCRVALLGRDNMRAAVMSFVLICSVTGAEQATAQAKPKSPSEICSQQLGVSLGPDGRELRRTTGGNNRAWMNCLEQHRGNSQNRGLRR
jgi:hypothetical protein